MKKLLALGLLFALHVCAAFGATWYIDTQNGGPQTGANNCTGHGLTAYNPSGGANQPCPFNDERWLWNNQTYGVAAWIIAGGDIVEFRNMDLAHASQAAGANPSTSDFCTGIGPYCSSPPVPSGTLLNPTTFRGENYAACTVADARGVLHPDKTKTSYLWGGGGSGQLFDVSPSQHVHFSCLDMTDHAACNGITLSCSGLEWSQRAIASGGTVPAVNGDITLDAVNIHGFQSRGIIGNIGGKWVLNATDIFANGSAGWDFDWGGAQDSHNGIVEMHEGSISWNGCTEQYPIVNAIPIQPNGCADQDNGGYGDGVGTPPDFGLLSMWFDHVEADYNTQDAIDLGHVVQGTLKFTRNYAEGNMAGTFKSGQPTISIVHNNVSNGNCQRMIAPITGAPTGYNNGLSLWCRAGGDILSVNYDPSLGHTLTADWQFNTFIGYGATMVDPQCSTSGSPVSCSGGPGMTWNYSNNVMLGYIDPAYNAGQAPGWGNSMSPTTQAKNLWYGMRNNYASAGDLDPTSSTSPNFTSQPASPMANETSLDSFNFYPNTGSPLIHVGTYAGSVPADFYSATRPNPPTVGAAEPFNPDQTATPSIAPGTGSYSSVTVTLGDTTPSAVICYKFGSVATTNGLGTGCGAGSTLYTGTFPVTTTSTLYAIAQAPGFTSSLDNHADYTITVVPSGSVTVTGTVTFSGTGTAQ